MQWKGPISRKQILHDTSQNPAAMDRKAPSCDQGLRDSATSHPSVYSEIEQGRGQKKSWDPLARSSQGPNIIPM